MHPRNRREFILSSLAAAGVMLVWPLPLKAGDPCQIPHPIAPPNLQFKGQCPNCGMVRAMWARTWMTFENPEGPSGACSFHCLADMALKSGETPRNVKVALYTQPEMMHPAETAFFVVGSSARGTMTMQSKIALETRDAATRFSQSCGGRVVAFEAAFELARQGVPKENKVIAGRRKTMKKIVEPRDNRDRCPVCEMFPARYPRHKGQIQTRDKNIHHFCSTQCLFTFLQDSARYTDRKVDPFLIWVVDYASGTWISARTAYYVVGTPKMGPMGREAFAFDRKADADAFARRQAGTVLPFKTVTPARIQG
ncbi:MAG: nitrous oxide reductase accessory protein NosL [Desulfosarcina sp.]|nr:nitrous oxide reductase accessory protein NosL [Desulfobacterales bacterium]